jgi:hypothetical protein
MNHPNYKRPLTKFKQAMLMNMFLLEMDVQVRVRGELVVRMSVRMNTETAFSNCFDYRGYAKGDKHERDRRFHPSGDIFWYRGS